MMADFGSFMTLKLDSGQVPVSVVPRRINVVTIGPADREQHTRCISASLVHPHGMWSGAWVQAGTELR